MFRSHFKNRSSIHVIATPAYLQSVSARVREKRGGERGGGLGGGGNEQAALVLKTVRRHNGGSCSAAMFNNCTGLGTKCTGSIASFNTTRHRAVNKRVVWVSPFHLCRYSRLLARLSCATFLNQRRASHVDWFARLSLPKGAKHFFCLAVITLHEHTSASYQPTF